MGNPLRDTANKLDEQALNLVDAGQFVQASEVLVVAIQLDQRAKQLDANDFREPTPEDVTNAAALDDVREYANSLLSSFPKASAPHAAAREVLRLANGGGDA